LESSAFVARNLYRDLTQETRTIGAPARTVIWPRVWLHTGILPRNCQPSRLAGFDPGLLPLLPGFDPGNYRDLTQDLP
jgi:hypothetical protein